MGIPTVTLATLPFEKAAQTAARIHALPDLPIVAIPHDYLHERPEAIRIQVDKVLEPLLQGLFETTG